MAEWLMQIFHVENQLELFWVIFGVFAQIMFTGRFLVQWLVSERERRSVMPPAFWYLSMVGGIMLLAYALYRQDPVFILGQLFGVVIYSRNLWLIHRERRDGAA